MNPYLNYGCRVRHVLAMALLVTGCAPVGTGVTSTTMRQTHPDVIQATVDEMTDGTFTFEATISSPYDTPERYADAWRVRGGDGTVYGIRELTHDHAGEQPFTRSLSGVQIPASITEVTVEGRDLFNGWGGATVVVALPGR